MSGFLYFVPVPRSVLVHGDRLQHERLPASLADILHDVHEVPAQCVAVETTKGPDGQAGTVLYPIPPHGDLPTGLGYYPDRQIWREIPSDGPRTTDHGHFLGWLTDAPPQAPDLERREQLSGYLCQDGLSQKWSVPVIRSPDNPRGNLPWEIQFDAADRPSCAVSGRHRQLWDDSATLWDWALTRGQPTREGLLILGEGFTADEDQFLLDCAFRGLAVNYRLDRHAIAALAAIRSGWLTQVFASLIVNALIDFQAKRAWEDAQKKTVTPSAPAGVSFTPGDPDAGQASNPAAEN